MNHSFLKPTRFRLQKNSPQGEIATLAAGCFWGVEEELRKLPGVLATAVGFMGGRTENPSYDQVCTGKTGHAEVVHLEFDPHVVSFEKILDLFWALHDPTTLNRQGPDVGNSIDLPFFFTAKHNGKLPQSRKRPFKNQEN